MHNMFCTLESITNESDVEQFFTINLLKYLGYTDANIKTKTSLSDLVVGRGSSRENYKPDYVCFIGKKPKIVLDAKAPDEKLENFTYQVCGYSLALNRKFKDENPVRYAILTNGVEFKLYNWDEEDPVLVMEFKDFAKDNPKFNKLIELLSFDSIKNQTGVNELSPQDFLMKPSVEEIKATFNKAHNLIWKKEKISPTDAFYEFSKIIFVKLNEDKRVREIIKERALKRSDFKFSLDWINEREAETEKPISSILFRELQQHLQEQIDRNKKKPIFQKDEEIELKSDTIKEVVKLLQDKDLYTIDEDLNGRMFETFLNATIRGRELGQYFTPRKVVKFMTKLAKLQVKRIGNEYKVDTVIDACCGSGGFLIDALADMLEKVKESPTLQAYKNDLLDIIKNKSIYGLEANSKISRIARMNMYVHGDGGSRIYCADSLDKKVSINRGTNSVIKKELEELQKLLVENSLKFDVVLTNPPFSMSYMVKERDEKEILKQYADTDKKNNIAYKEGTTELKSSVKSNVLFLARYFDLLKPGGRMFIILDNSVINSYSHKEYRDYIRNNFIIKAVIQLPTHTFVNQQAGGITSILYLEKKTDDNQLQPSVFYRNVKNVGHNKSGKEEDVDDFEEILKEYEKYEETGKLFKNGLSEIKDYEDDDLFIVDSTKLDDRLDIFYHQPSYAVLKESMIAFGKSDKCEIKSLKDFKRIKPDIRNNPFAEDDSHEFKYVEISSIDKERGVIIDDEWEEGTLDILPNRAKLFVKKGDLIFSKPYRSLKKVALIPEELDNEVVSSGFYCLRLGSEEDSLMLWSIFRSNLIQKQFRHLVSGYTQRELNDEYLDELIIPIPKDRSKISEKIKENMLLALEARKVELKAYKNLEEIPIDFIS